MLPIVVGIVFVALTILFAILAVRVSGAKNPLARWLDVILAGLLTVVFALIGAVDLVGVIGSTLHGEPGKRRQGLDHRGSGRPRRAPRPLCASCHSTPGDLPLDGGRASMLSNPGGSGFRTLYAPNLTPGGPLKNWSDGEIMRAIREGVEKDGRALIIMPSQDFHAMTDADVQASVAYRRSQPAVPYQTPPRDIGVIGTLLIGTGLFPTAAQAPITWPDAAPPAGGTAEYGEYLDSTAGCRSCHGADLAGGRAGGSPLPGPNLTQMVPTWSETDFIATIRPGKDPNGDRRRPDLMPWKALSAAFSDDELKAICAYLHELTPIKLAAG